VTLKFGFKLNSIAKTQFQTKTSVWNRS